ncbi:uncharacterized protein LOC129980545 [Argiope bruennichi]|uniref:uncharacterized protein LOC129980545 n=1 Tax=Argiope bruennichi TaxID=94029 RepID=UPI0024959278|nr:uncharacterized protein LOC129980545 [Argiope bruennichi]
MFLAKLLFFLIIGTSFLKCRSQEKQIRGTPEVDYPTYYIIPKTSFRCSEQLYNPGFYADIETRCQVFHYCYEHRQESFLCPMGTVFNQPLLACDYWYSSNCSLAPSYYHVNAVKRNEDFGDVAEEPEDLQSENLFDKMAHLYEINKTPEPLALKNDSGIAENELLSRDSIKSSGEPLIERNNKTEDYNKYSYDNRFNMADEKHPEIVKYEVVGLDAIKVHKGSENQPLYDTDNENDFILSEDGKLHPNQDVYQLYPTDMNFDQGYSGYAEIPSEENVNDDLNGDYESDFQMSSSELQRRYSNMNENVRRPLSRKPIIIVPEEPEIVQLPVMKHKRKPVGIPSTTSANTNGGSSYETTHDSNIYKEDTASSVTEGLAGTASSRFQQDELKLNYEFNDSKLFYEIQKQVGDETGSHLDQTETSSIIYDYSNKKNTRNAYVLSNADEEQIESIFGSGSNDLSSNSNTELRNTLVDSNHGHISEIFIESSTAISDEGAGIAAEGDPSLGSGSEENIIRFHPSDKSSFLKDQDVFSDSEDMETINKEISYALPMNLSDTSEGSGTSVQETEDMPNFVEEDKEPIEIILKGDSDYSNGYNRESSFSLETFGEFLPSSSSEHNEGTELVDGSGGSSEFNYLPHELQESSDILYDTSDKMVPEIQEIDGSYYYVFPDSDYHSNSEYEDSSEFYSENEDYSVTENFGASSDKLPEELIDNTGSRYFPVDSELKTDDTERLSDEFEMETSPNIPEEYIVDDFDSTGQLSTEDLKFLEIMTQSPIPLPMNLFDVSNEKSSSNVVKDEIPHFEIMSLEQDVDDQAAAQKGAGSMEEAYEIENLSSNISPDIEKHSSEVESSEINPEFSVAEQKMVEDGSVYDQAATQEGADDMEDVYENFSSNISQDTEKHSAEVESSEINPEILEAEQNIAEDGTVIDGSSQEESEILSEQNLEALIPGKEIDPFNPLFAEGSEILGSSDSRKKSSLNVNSVKAKNTVVNPAAEKDLKKVTRGKRLNENLRTFNPSSKGYPLITPSRDTFREAVFSNIPTSFLKMKHSTLRPYFYNYELKNSGFYPRTGDLFESSKFSTLTSLGKKLLEAKRSKFSRIKKYIDSYRNN